MSYEKISLKPRTYAAQNDAIRVDKGHTQLASQNPFEKKQEETLLIKKNTINIDIDALVDKYKKNPLGVFDELGFEFTKEEKETLGAFITDKKSLKAFLNFAKEQELTKEDIIQGFKKLNEMAPSGTWKKIGNFFKTIFDDGLAEAFKLAKSEKVYRAEKMSETMGEIREERQDFTAKNVAEIAQTTTVIKEIKQNIMHFVTKKDKNGKHLYSENATMKANAYMYENVDKAATFTANAVELEAIKGPNNTIKYSGDTIVNVSTRMTDKPELKNTMLQVGKKSDMTDSYFDNITDNLYKNPCMESTISFMVTAKKQDGTDRFSAGNANSASTHLVKKNEKYCSSYHNNITTLSQNENINGDDVVRLNTIATTHPELRDEIIERCKQNPNNVTKLIEEYEEKYSSNNTQTNASRNTQYDDYDTEVYSHEKDNTNSNNKTYIEAEQREKFENISKQIFNTKANNATYEENYTDKTNIGGQEYSRTAVLNALYKNYGEHSEKILQHLEENPEFIDMMKKYGNNKKLVAALVDNPQIINQLKTASSSITTNELTEMVELCNNQKTLNMMKELTNKYGAIKAIKIVKSAKICNLLDETENILNINTKDAKTKKEEIENLVTCPNSIAR